MTTGNQTINQVRQSMGFPDIPGGDKDSGIAVGQKVGGSQDVVNVSKGQTQTTSTSSSSENLPAQTQQVQTVKPQRVYVSPTGRVTVGSTSYYGNAKVPELGGLTVNEYNAQLRSQAVASGNLDVRNYGRASFQGDINTESKNTPMKENPQVNQALKSDPNLVFSNSPQGRLQGTYTKSYSPPNTKSDIHLEPYLTKEQIGTITDPVTGKEIPVYSQLKYIDPFGKSLGGGAYTQSEREATPEEQIYFKEQTSIAKIGTSKPGFFTPIVRKAGEIYGTLSQDVYQSNQAGSDTLKSIGVTDKNIGSVSNLVGYVGVFPKAREFVSGAVEGVAKNIRDKPFTNAALVGAGYAGGLALEGAPLLLRGGARAIGLANKAQTIGNVAKATTSLAGIGLTGAFVFSKGKEMVNAKTAKESGNIFGVGALEAGEVGFGFSRGATRANKIASIIKSGGREFLETQQGEYPQANPDKQLKMFQQNVIPELGVEPGAFHTTSDIFWQDKIIKPKAGSSELPGLYASTKVSTPFARISGSGSLNNVNIVDNIKSLFVLNEPGIAYLKPKGFREVGFKSVTPYQAEEGGSFFDYAFKKPAKPGFMDVPKMKSEIEAVARTDAGSYGFESGKYYTEIKGQRVPIDVFKYDEGTSGTSPKGKFEPSNYEYPTDNSFRPDSYGFNELSYKRSSSPSSLKVSSSEKSSMRGSSSSSTSSLKSSVSSASSSANPSSTLSSVGKTSILSSAISKVLSSISSRDKSSSFSQSPYRPSSGSSKNNPSYITTFNSSKKDMSESLRKKLAKGFKTFFIKNRKKVYLPGIRPRKEAIVEGEKTVLSDLKATFGIEPTNVEVFGDNQDYEPNMNIFRNYRIRGNSRIPIENTWIQKAGTQKEGVTIKGARLAGSGERQEIQLFKKMKSKNRKKKKGGVSLWS